MVQLRDLKGLGLPRRVGSEDFAELPESARTAILAEFAALDQNLREILNRIDDQIVLGIVAYNAAGARLEGEGLSSVELFDFVADGDNLKLQSRAVHPVGTLSTDFALDAANGYDQSLTISASVDLTGISNLTGPTPFSIRVAAGANTLTLDGAAFEGPTLAYTGNIGLTFKDFGTGKLVAMGSDW